MSLWSASVKSVFAAFLVAACGSAAWAQEKEYKLESWLDGDKDIWSAEAESFISGDKKAVYLWTSEQNKTTARHSSSFKNSRLVTFCGQKVWECLVNFKDNKIDNIAVFLYNRGDAGDMSKEQFEDAVEAACKSVQTWAGGGKFADEEKKIVNENNIYYKLWQKEPFSVVINWSCSGKSSKTYRPEYIKLTFYKHNTGRKFLEDIAGTGEKSSKSSSESKGSLDLASNVVKEENGDVFIKDVPMVDQGAKGYCVVAATERVLRYYGEDVDQHLLGQIADSSADQGTNVLALAKALQKAGSVTGVKVRELYVNKDMDGYNNMTKVMNNYNKEAKKKKLQTIKLSDFTTVSGNTTWYYPYRLLAAMDPEVMVDMRCNRDKNHYKEFLNDVKEFTTKGVPLVWSIFVGKIREDGIPASQKAAGHVRLIIGYNEKDKQIIYTDSWGSGHEFKKMGMDEAWAITTAVLLYVPKKAKGIF